jgi:hypothetical protein
MRLVLGSAVIILSAALACSAAFAKGGMSLPRAWRVGTEAEVPKGTVAGGDACAKVTAVAHDLDQPFIDPTLPRDQLQSGRDRMSGKGQYADPKELKNWVEFRLRETCGNKKLWAQMWGKTGLSKNYHFAMVRKCPGWTMKQNYLTPAAADSFARGTYLSLNVYNYSLAPKSVEVRFWAANDYEGQAKGTATCPK